MFELQKFSHCGLPILQILRTLIPQSRLQFQILNISTYNYICRVGLQNRLDEEVVRNNRTKVYTYIIPVIFKGMFCNRWSPMDRVGIFLRVKNNIGQSRLSFIIFNFKFKHTELYIYLSVSGWQNELTLHYYFIFIIYTHLAANIF